MSTLKLRPTFSLPLSQHPDAFFVDLKKAILENSSEYFGRFTSRHAMISIVPEKRHFWSPCLNLEIRDSERGKELFGRFSPHPSIWTGFMFAYLALAVLSFFSMILGCSQYLISESPWGFVLIPVWIVIGFALWIASQAGQRLSVNEMQDLKTLVDQVTRFENSRQQDSES